MRRTWYQQGETFRPTAPALAPAWKTWKTRKTWKALNTWKTFFLNCKTHVPAHQNLQIRWFEATWLTKRYVTNGLANIANQSIQIR